MLKIQKWVVNPCQECTHVVSDETGKAVIIDCGVYYPSERRHLLEYIAKEQLHPVRLLMTHKRLAFKRMNVSVIDVIT